MYCDGPLQKEPDFWSIGTGATIVAGDKALEAVQTMFEMAGELLPLPYAGKMLTVLNVTECINCLDHEKCEWRTARNGIRLYPTRYVFHSKRFNESSLFKVPEVRTSTIFCLEHEFDPQTEFKAAVEEAGLQGLSL